MASDENGGRAGAGLAVEEADEALVVRPRGHWVIDRAEELGRNLAPVQRRRARAVVLRLDALETLDTAGAWLLVDAWREWAGTGADVRLENARAEHQALLDQIRERGADKTAAPAAGDEGGRRGWVADLGAGIDAAGRECVRLLAFGGALLACLARVLGGRSPFRLASLCHHMEEVWIKALPIVGLLSFLVGIVLTFQAAVQLGRFGAESWAVDLTGISVLRETGVLLPAVVVAGRSASSFTAQIGAMKVRQEIDAMQAIGIDPLGALVMPRVVALLVTFPFLVLFGEVLALAGGAAIAWAALGLSPVAFVERLGDAVGPAAFLVGMSKAPVFGALIALVGCYHGLEVQGSAADLGRHTTQSVVVSLFAVIVADALFSVFYSVLGI